MDAASSVLEKISVNHAARTALATCLAVIPLASVAAKQPKPANGSWQIVPVPLETPRTVTVGEDDVVILAQPLVPEAVRSVSAPLTVGKLGVAAGDTLFRATTKQGTAWCALAPLRKLPDEKKMSGLARAFLGGPTQGPGPDALCFGDADGDGIMESAMTGSSKGYALPIITKLGKPTAIAPFSTSPADPLAISDWHVELRASAAKRKDGTDTIYSLILTSPSGAMSIDGFRLLAGEGNSFAIFGNLATIDTKFDSVTPARVNRVGSAADGKVEMRVDSVMAARGMTLGNPQPY